MDYRDILATVVGASVAGLVAFAIRLIFPINAAVLALVYAATYSLLWVVVDDRSKTLFHRYLPASTRPHGRWRRLTGVLAIVAAGAAGLIVAYALSRPTSVASSTTAPTATTIPSLVTQTIKLQPRVVVNKKTIVLPVETRIVTSVAPTVPGQTATVISHTVIVQRPPVTITVSSTEAGRTETVTEATPTVTSPGTTATVEATVSETTTVSDTATLENTSPAPTTAPSTTPPDPTTTAP